MYLGVPVVIQQLRRALQQRSEDGGWKLDTTYCQSGNMNEYS